MTDQIKVLNESFFTKVFDRWRSEIREILDSHKKDIAARLEQIERNLEKKSDKEHVELMVKAIQADLERHASELDEIQTLLSKKMGTETMWKIIGLGLTFASMLGGMIGFLISLALKK